MATTVDELPRDWWTTVDIASYLGVKPNTVRRYLAIGHMPKPDRSIPGRNFWRPRTIIKWHASRPRVSKTEPGDTSGSTD